MVCVILAPELELHREIRGEKIFRGWDCQHLREMPHPQLPIPRASLPMCPGRLDALPAGHCAHSFIFPMVGRIDLVLPL